MIGKILLLLAAFIVVPVAMLALVSLTAKKPTNLGVTNGRLSPCPASPNCVCTFKDDDKHAVEPLKFTGDAGKAWADAKAAVALLPRTTVVDEKDGYLHAEYRTATFGFVDDVELLLDAPKNEIHVRMAARSGYSDLGANRSRVETLRREFDNRRQR